MKATMMKIVTAVSLFCALCEIARGQGTAFAYQGSLNDGGNPANGNYDMEFYLRDALTAGNPVGTTNTVAPVAASNGLFTVTLDFGNQFNGNARWLEVGVSALVLPDKRSANLVRSIVTGKSE